MDTLREFEEYIRSADDSMHRLLRLAVVHYQFEAIHPFNDGNGRVGRLLISLLSVSWGLLPLPLLYLSAYLERSRAEYYALLQGVTERGEWRDWIAFFLRGVTQQSADAATRAMRLHDVGVELQGRAVAAKAPGGAVALAGRLVERPILTINLAMSLIGGDVTYHNARRQVHRLVELGILEPYFSSGHQDYFVAKEVMRAVEEEAPQGE